MSHPNCARPFSNLYHFQGKSSKHACCYSPACSTFTFGSCPILLNCINCMNLAAVASQLWSSSSGVYHGKLLRDGGSGEKGLLIRFSSRWSSSPEPAAVPCRLLLPYHNGMTNGAMKISEVQWPSLRLSLPPMPQGSTVQPNKLCITDEMVLHRLSFSTFLYFYGFKKMLKTSTGFIGHLSTDFSLPTNIASPLPWQSCLALSCNSISSDTRRRNTAILYHHFSSHYTQRERDRLKWSCAKTTEVRWIKCIYAGGKSTTWGYHDIKQTYKQSIPLV